MINDNISITVLRSSQNTVYLGIEAPPDVKIWRQEIHEKIGKKPSRKTFTLKDLKR